jgi:molecular chaperone HtpG
MATRQGEISVSTADIFPIIKKWLYSEHDIFLRELVANATDAITKRSTLGRSLNTELPEGQILVQVDKENKKIIISDNGVGMSEEEVEKYIAQLAFSGAEDFVNKMKDAGADAKDANRDDIIGKFGLGFYSAFMVADKVEIDTLSMNEGAKASNWICEGSTTYEFNDSKKTEIGTTITLHVNDDGLEFLDQHKVTATLGKFCDFMPYSIKVDDLNWKAPEPTKDKDGNIEVVAKPEPTLVNDAKPLWKQDPKTLKDEDYINFFRKLYPMEQEPLFWIHLKVDHPFTLEGILYFPKINPNKPFNESNIRLFCKQVFVSDNVKNIIPEFLSLLKGVIDSNDIPLNVSRSSLQGDPNVRRISNYIVKKVGEALKKLFKTDRPKFEAIWQDIGLFVKYGIISEPKFDEIMRSMTVFTDSEGNYKTLSEYKESIPEAMKEKMGDKIIYFEKGKSDISLRKQLLDEGIHSIETEDHIDPHFMQHVESNTKDDLVAAFTSVDSAIGEILASGNATEEDMKIKDFFGKVLSPEDANPKKDDKGEPLPNPDAMQIEIQKLSNVEIPAFFKVDEQMKRFAKMAQNMGGGMANPFPLKKILVINPNNSLIQNAMKLWEKGEKDSGQDLAKKICHHVEDLANISSEGLKDEDRQIFVSRSQDLIKELSSLAL